MDINIEKLFFLEINFSLTLSLSIFEKLVTNGGNEGRIQYFDTDDRFEMKNGYKY